MGMHLNVVVGFFLEVVPQKIENKKIIKTCLNESCQKHKKEVSDNFCNKCGGKIDSFELVSKIETSSIYDLLPTDRGFVDLVYSGEGSDHIWLLNQYFDDYKRFNAKFSDDGCSEYFEIPYEEISTKKESLLTQNGVVKKVVDYMTENYGKDSIKLKYGATYTYL